MNKEALTEVLEVSKVQIVEKAIMLSVLSSSHFPILKEVKPQVNSFHILYKMCPKLEYEM